MKVLFCSDMFNDVENDVKNSRYPNPVSGHKFQENLLRGLIQNEIDIEVVNSTRIRAYPDYNRIFSFLEDFIFENMKVGETLPFINLPILNRMTQIISLIFYLKRFLRNLEKEKIIILVWNTNYVTLIPAIVAKLQYSNILICDCIGDIYGKYGTTGFSTDVQLQYLKRKAMEFFSDLYRKCDCFVFLTNDMRDVLELQNKPYCVVEAIYDLPSKKLQPTQHTESEGKNIFYAGSVNLEYGMKHLLNAFSLIKDQEFKLQIAGNGDAVNLVQECCKNDSRISYLGVIPPSDVAKFQAQATVLVSPRKSTEPFVKYSFPSKTVECLASGKPYVAHRLPCEPSEYADYIQYPDDESDEALARKLEEVCNLPEEERRRIGERGRHFIETEKNPKIMCKRIVDMWHEMLGE